MIGISVSHDIDAIRAEWTELHTAVGSTPFLTWEWARAWFRHLAPADAKPLLIRAEADGELIGILPLFISSPRRFGLRVRTIGFIGSRNGGADYLDVIAAEQKKPQIWAAILAYLAGQTDFDVMRFENVASRSVLRRTIARGDALPTDFVPAETDGEPCPQVDLGEGWDAVLRRSRRRDNFKRRLKKLEKVDGFEFRSVTALEEIGAAFERFAVLHERRWENHGGSAATGLPDLMEFHRNVVGSLAARGLIRFDEIWADGECRASVYGLDDGVTFQYYNAGYDLDWASMSVGLVLVGLSIRAACVRGNRVYDFLRGDETYKYDWTETGEQLIDIRIARPTFRAKVDAGFESLWSQARRFITNILPQSATAQLRAVVRRVN